MTRFREDVINLKPKTVVINAGTNDIAENTGMYDEDVTMGNIITMVELAQYHTLISTASKAFHMAYTYPARGQNRESQCPYP